MTDTKSEQLIDVGSLESNNDSGIKSKWTALALLTLVNALLTLDRTIPQIVAEPIKLEFGLTDSQLGILLGITFAIPYAVAGLALGPLVDSINRKKYLSVLVAIWSMLTLLTGAVSGFIHLLIIRAGLGAAEATGGPVAYSLVGDLFPAGRRSTAVGVYKIGVPLGIFLAGSIASLVVGAYGWRAAFFFAGIPGLVVAILVGFTMKEPVRGGMDEPALRTTGHSYIETLAFVLCNKIITPLVLAVLLAVFSGAALSGFAAPFLQRYHNVEVAEAGVFFAIGSVLSLTSPVILGLLGDRIVKRGNNRLAVFMGLYAAVMTVVAVTMLLISNSIASIIAFILWQVLALGLMAPSYGLLISLTPSDIRGTVMAITGVGTMGIGFGLGPMITGFVSDSVGGAEALRWALVSVVGISGFISAMLYIVSALNLLNKEKAEVKI